MCRNLDVAFFRNGDAVPYASTAQAWMAAVADGSPAWCYYDHLPANGVVMGKLYNWFAFNDPRGLAPVGWQLPSMRHWHALASATGGVATCGNVLKSAHEWYNNGQGTDSIGFGGLPAGIADIDGNFYDLGKAGRWWSADIEGPEVVWACCLVYGCASMFDSDYNKRFGMSVRCIRET